MLILLTPSVSPGDAAGRSWPAHKVVTCIVKRHCSVFSFDSLIYLNSAPVPVLVRSTCYYEDVTSNKLLKTVFGQWANNSKWE